MYYIHNDFTVCVDIWHMHQISLLTLDILCTESQLLRDPLEVSQAKTNQIRSAIFSSPGNRRPASTSCHSMADLHYTVIDAFTQTRFKGNQAAVVLFEEGDSRYDSDTLLCSIAKEFGFSETGFVIPLLDWMASSPHYRLRWFTPKVVSPNSALLSQSIHSGWHWSSLRLALELPQAQ